MKINLAETPQERSLLLYFETCAVDHGGTFEAVRMNANDFAIADRWRERGFIRYGRISAHTMRLKGCAPRTHWVLLSSKAWREAHAERRARFRRVNKSARDTYDWLGAPTP